MSHCFQILDYLTLGRCPKCDFRTVFGYGQDCMEPTLKHIELNHPEDFKSFQDIYNKITENIKVGKWAV